MSANMPMNLWMRPDDEDNPDFMPEITSRDDSSATRYVRGDFCDEQASRIRDLELALNGVITEFCDREGDDDLPAPSDEQSKECIAYAMAVLDA